jgi:hypothetical protein
LEDAIFTGLIQKWAKLGVEEDQEDYEQLGYRASDAYRPKSQGWAEPHEERDGSPF